MGGSRTPALGAVLLLLACDMQSNRRLKLPEKPPMPEVEPKADPMMWAQRGDVACPAISVASTTGAPGTTVRSGRLTRHPGTGALACQVDGTNHGPATDVEVDGSTAFGDYQLGRRSGRWEGRFKGGAIRWHGTFAGGVEVGQWSYWDRDGGMLATGAVEGQRRTGMWLFWDRPIAAPGQPSRFEVYHKGRVRRRGVIEDGAPILTHPVCALGYAAPRCKTIIGAGLTYRRGPRNRTDGGDADSMSIDGSFTVNFLRHHGFGVSGSIYAGDEFARYGARAVYRHYLQRVLAVDVSLGLLYARGGLAPGAASVGHHGRLEITLGDQLAIGTEVARFDHDGEGGTKWAAFATVRVGLIPLAMVAYIAASIGAH